MTEEERNLDFIISELEQENRLLRARNERLENREWVGLTTEDVYACDKASGLPQYEITTSDLQAFAFAIEAKLKEKNQ